ncbi:hypothetical protein Scep_012301 [Stephania cephalantha]|uniref:Uncharacterized protein n=1 Tax=Stephania cephalantha TaxID=152367 RepID=A0AAP0P6L1_9MAGN
MHLEPVAKLPKHIYFQLNATWFRVGDYISNRCRSNSKQRTLLITLSIKPILLSSKQIKL